MKNILLIVDPQNDFITGTLAVEGAKEKMDSLINCIKLQSYDFIFVTLDSHPKNHCSFIENGGQWPPHCIKNTEGWFIYFPLENVLIDKNAFVFYKGTDKEEYSIFDNKEDGKTLENWITEIFCEDRNISIDICGIAGDYCVLETLKGLRKIIGDKHIKVLTEYTASIDGGEKLTNYLQTNDIYSKIFTTI